MSAAAVEFNNVSFAFDDQVILRNASFTVPRGGMSILLGASGSGKSVLLKLVLGLFRPDSGDIVVNGHHVNTMPERDLLRLRSGVGMSFQEIALFDSLTVAENVGYRLYEESQMPIEDADRRVAEVLGFVGLAEYGDRMPSELSGGQRRRVAIARSMASKPDILLFDDPTTGLDPIIATSVDDELVKLRDLEQVTSIMATHQIRDAFYITNHEAVKTPSGVDIRETSTEQARFLVLHDHGIYFEGTGAELLASQDSFLKEFLSMTLPPW